MAFARRHSRGPHFIRCATLSRVISSECVHDTEIKALRQDFPVQASESLPVPAPQGRRPDDPSRGIMIRPREAHLAAVADEQLGDVEIRCLYASAPKPLALPTFRVFPGGGLERNKHARDRLNAGRGGVGKTIVLGAKDRDTNRVAAKVVPDTRAKTLQGFVEERTDPTAQVYTDDNASYVGMKRQHGTVRHSAGEYVRKQAHTNGMESFWATLKRAHKGVYHKMSRKHMDRYVREFAGRHNVREYDTIDQMETMVSGMEGKRLNYRTLKADNGLPSGARP